MANGVTSNTGTVAEGVVTFRLKYGRDKLFIYVNYDKGNGTSITMKVGTVSPKVHATNEYQETAFATATMASVTATFDTTGKHRFEFVPSYNETSLKVTFAFTGGTTQAVICDMVPE